MSDETRIRALFDAIVALPPADWDAALREQCENDSERDRVRGLLEAHARAEGFLAEPAIAAFPELAQGATRQIDEFRIVREIGRGGMGVVYLADDTVLGRKVAIKVMAGRLVSSDHAIARFRHEAKAAARLKDPNIVAVYRSGESAGLHFIAMEYVEGDTLGRRLDSLRALSAVSEDRGEPGRDTHSPTDDGPIEPSETPEPSSNGTTSSSVLTTSSEHRRSIARIVADVADALEFAHRNGVIHRDVKPSNILVDEQGRGRLTDFGIARIADDEGMTVTGDRPGTYYYMSPEQASAIQSEIDHRTDIFSLGVVLYECLSLRRPFEGKTAAQIIDAIRSQPAPSLRRISRGIPVDLATICHKAIEKSPGDRYQTAAHMAADLRCWLAGAPILAKPPSIPRRARQWVGRNKAGVVAAALIIAAALVSGLSWKVHEQRVRGMVALDVREPSGARVVVQSVDAESLEFSPPRALGSTPLRRRLEPGVYRVTVVAPSGAFAEYDEFLDPAERSELVIRARLTAGDDSHAGMALVPEGMHKIGRESTITFERAREIGLPAFWIDEREVSQDDYRKYLEATGAEPPPLWDDRAFDGSLGDRPMVGLTWNEMRAYAAWAGKRLPTIYEWEAAARWPDGRTQPWGSDPLPEELPALRAEHFIKQMRAESALSHDLYRELAQPVVGEGFARSPLGLYWLFGNANEATSTIMFGRNRTIIVKGGSYMDAPEAWDLSRNATALPTGHPSMTVGFRCARSASPPDLKEGE